MSETHVHADGTVHAGAHHHEEEDNLPKATASVEDAGPARKRIKIEVPAERIQGKLKEAFAELQRDAVLPGFRRGRAPNRLLEKRFGTDLRNTVKNQVVAEAYEKAIEDNKIEAIGEPEIDLAKVELPASGPLNVNVEVEVTPEFELPKLEGLEVKKPKLEANDERMNLAIDNLRRHFGHWHSTNAPATENDTVTADVKIQGEDNVVLTEQSNIQFPVKPGKIAGIQFDDLGAKLTGAAIGAEVKLENTVPQDYNAAELRGKKIHVTIIVRDVRHQHLPDVNEDFANMLGFENVDKLKDDLRERLVSQLEIEAKGAEAQQIYRYLLTNTTFQLPTNLSQRQSANVFRRRAMELFNRGVPEQEIQQHLLELRTTSSQQAAVDLKLFFILTKLAEQFGIEVNEEEVNARIASISAQYGRRPERLKHEMSADGRLEQLYVQIRDGKVVDKILESAKVTDVDEKALAEEFKNLPPLTGLGPTVTGVSSTPANEAANAT